MHGMKILAPVILVLCAAALLAGCTYTAPYDFERGVPAQIPNWDGEALVVCGGHLAPEDRTEMMTGRC
jgi:hypothetical protein